MTANGLGLALAATEGEARRMDRLGGSSAFKNRRSGSARARRRAFARELYREELRQHWRSRGLSKHDRLEVTRRYMRAWP